MRRQVVSYIPTEVDNAQAALILTSATLLDLSSEPLTAPILRRLGARIDAANVEFADLLKAWERPS